MNLRKLAVRLFQISSNAIGLLPHRILLMLGSLLGSMATIIPNRRIKIARDNLSMCYGDSLSQRQQRRIAHASFRHISMTAMEVLYATARARTPQRIDFERWISSEGEHYLQEAAQKGRGVILLTAHIGNFPWMLLYLGQNGYRMAVVYKEPADFKGDFFGNAMKAYNISPIRYSGKKYLVTKSILKHLAQGYIILMPLDQAKNNGVEVDFYAHPVKAAGGPVVLSRRSGAAIVPAFIYRRGQGHHLIIEPQVVLKEPENPQDDLRLNTQALSDIVEAAVRRHPEQWLWAHRRWR